MKRTKSRRPLREKRAASVVDFLRARDIIPAFERPDDDYSPRSAESDKSGGPLFDKTWNMSPQRLRRGSKTTLLTMPREPLVADGDKNYMKMLRTLEPLPELDLARLPRAKPLLVTKPHMIQSKQPHFHLSRSSKGLLGPAVLLQQSQYIAGMTAAADQIMTETRKAEKKRRPTVVASRPSNVVDVLDKKLAELQKKEKDAIEKRLHRPSYMQGNASTKARLAERPKSRASQERLEAEAARASVLKKMSQANPLRGQTPPTSMFDAFNKVSTLQQSSLTVPSHPENLESAENVAESLPRTVASVLLRRAQQARLTVQHKQQAASMSQDQQQQGTDPSATPSLNRTMSMKSILQQRVQISEAPPQEAPNSDGNPPQPPRPLKRQTSFQEPEKTPATQTRQSLPQIFRRSSGASALRRQSTVSTGEGGRRKTPPRRRVYHRKEMKIYTVARYTRKDGDVKFDAKNPKPLSPGHMAGENDIYLIAIGDGAAMREIPGTEVDVIVWTGAYDATGDYVYDQDILRDEDGEYFRVAMVGDRWKRISRMEEEFPVLLGEKLPATVVNNMFLAPHLMHPFKDAEAFLKGKGIMHERAKMARARFETEKAVFRPRMSIAHVEEGLVAEEATPQWKKELRPWK